MNIRKWLERYRKHCESGPVVIKPQNPIPQIFSEEKPKFPKFPKKPESNHKGEFNDDQSDE